MQPNQSPDGTVCWTLSTVFVCVHVLTGPFGACNFCHSDTAATRDAKSCMQSADCRMAPKLALNKITSFGQPTSLFVAEPQQLCEMCFIYVESNVNDLLDQTDMLRQHRKPKQRCNARLR